MRNFLFRPEALHGNTYRLHGDVLLRPNLAHSIVLGLLLLWLGLLLYLLLVRHITRKETVQDWLVPVCWVYAEATGIVKNLGD